jgi:hemoglobin
VQADQAAQRSDYVAVGRGPAVSAVVDLLYQLVLADPELAGFFEDSDLVRLKRHQVDLASQVRGGPLTYDGPDLASAHAGRGISDADFSRVVAHLIAALGAHHVAEDIIGRVAAALATTRADVVTAS